MIDRLDLKHFVADYTSFLKKTVLFVISAIHQSLFSFLLILIVAVALAWGYYASLTPYYETDMVCAYNNARVSRKTYGEMAQKLNLLAQTGSAKELAKQLGLSPAQTSHILRIDAKNMAGSPLYEDITDNYQSIYFTVRSNDRTVFGPLQRALASYLSNGPYQKQAGVIELAKLNSKIKYLEQDLTRVDSITEAYAVFVRNSKASSDSVTGFSNISTLISYKEQLEDRKTGLEQKLALEGADGVQVISGFAPADQPVNELGKYLLKGFLAGLVVAVCWSLIRRIITVSR